MGTSCHQSPSNHHEISDDLPKQNGPRHAISGQNKSEKPKVEPIPPSIVHKLLVRHQLVGPVHVDEGGA